MARFKNLTHHYVHQQGRPEAGTFWAGCGAVRRSALRGYSLPLLDLLLALVGAATFVTYAVYTFTAALTPLMALTLPFVAVGLGRYVFLVRRRKVGEEPERVLLSDRTIIVSVVAWAATAAAVLLSVS